MRFLPIEFKLPSRKIQIIAAVTGAVILSIILWLVFRNRGAESYKTVAVARGDVTPAIGASGTVEPEEVIDVGAQVAGRILRFGKDKAGKPIDYGSQVEEGMILAYIDDIPYASDLTQVTAQLDQSRAGVVKAKADLDQMKAKLYQADREWKRAQELGAGEALSQSEYDITQSNFETAKANVQVSQAAIRQAELTVVQSQASVNRARQNLNYCIIRSPIRGIIIDRRVNIGQTVVASLSAPSLFLIAKDLRRIQIWVPVNEADIGSIKAGQPVEFTVDAHPGLSFKGVVGKVRLNATMTQNVVTYTVVVNTENPDGKLLPYLTANVKFVMAKRTGVLFVPNAALLWSPSGRVTPKKDKENKDKEKKDKDPDEDKSSDGFSKGTVWILEGKKPQRVRVKTGLTNGSVTEVQDLTEGMQVIVGVNESGQADSGGEVNPFTPKMPQRKR